MWIALALLFLSSFIRLPISPIIFALGAILGIFLSALGMKKSLKISKIIEMVCAGIVLVVMIAVLAGADGENDKYVQTVKSGTIEAYPQKTVGEAFDNYLINAVWESGEAENGQRFVNVKGEILYEGKNAEIIVQFFVDDDNEFFQYNACEINGVPQNDLTVLYLFDTVFNYDSAAITPDLKEGSNNKNRILIGETQSFDDAGYGNLEVTLDYVEFCDKGENESGIGYIYPNENCVFLYAGFTVKNIGTKNGSFTAPSTVIYDGIYEFEESYSRGGLGDIMSIKPLSPPVNTMFIYEIPIDVAKSDKSLVLNIDNLISFIIRSGSDNNYDMETKAGMSSTGIEAYEGSWHGLEYVNDRMFMEISYVDANGGYFDISISWSSSASEWTQWELQGVYTEEGVMRYYGNEIEYESSYETGETKENVVSQAEEGVLWIGDDGLLYWDDYTEPSGETFAFEKSVY